MGNRLRILTIGHSYGIALNRAIAREVARDPYFQVTVAAPSFFHGDLRSAYMEPEPSGSPLQVVPVKTHLSSHIHVFYYDMAALRALVRNNKFDVVHAWEEPYILAGYQIARALTGNPARFCFRTAQSYVKRYPPPFGYFERAVLRRAQGWIAGAGLVFQAMLEKGFPKDIGRILNLAVDLAEFRPLTAEARCEVLTELGLKPPVIGFIGRLTRAKGLDILMQAMEQVGMSREWSLLCLGSGDYQEKLRSWADRQGWSDRVKVMLTKHSEVPRYLGAMDLLVAPSQTMKNWREQFGRMIIEAFACGVPVIGSDSGEIPFVVGEAGKIVGETDVAGWAHTIRHLLEDPAERERLRSRGLARSPRFSVVSIAQKYREYYQWLAAQPVGAC